MTDTSFEEMTLTSTRATKRNGILNRIRRSSPEHCNRSSRPCSRSESQPVTTTSQVPAIPMGTKPNASNVDNVLRGRSPWNERNTYRQRLRDLVRRKKDRNEHDQSAERMKQGAESRKWKLHSIANDRPQVLKPQFCGVNSETVDNSPRIGSMPVEYLVQLTTLRPTCITMARNEVWPRTHHSQPKCKPSSYQYQPSMGERRPPCSAKTQDSGFRPTTSNAESPPRHSRLILGRPAYDAKGHWEHAEPEEPRPGENIGGSLLSPLWTEFSRVDDLNFSCLRCREARQCCFAGPSNGIVTGHGGNSFSIAVRNRSFSSFKS